MQRRRSSVRRLQERLHRIAFPWPIVHHSIYGHFAIRDEKWKLLMSSGSGGWSKQSDAKKPGAAKRQSQRQLYDMELDPGEAKNLQADHPEVVQKLEASLGQIVIRGRSTPGKPTKNDVEVNWIKSGK